MANEKIKQNYKDIANAIRSKTGENGLITAEEMPDKISHIETGIEPSGTLEITENGNDINVREYEYVNVDIDLPVLAGNLYYCPGCDELQQIDLNNDSFYRYDGEGIFSDVEGIDGGIS